VLINASVNLVGCLLVNMALLIHPFTCIVAGPTQVGKTFWVKRLVKEVQRMIKPCPTEILWCYTEWQSGYEELSGLSGLTLCEGLPDFDKLKADKEKPKLLILDDFMDTLKKDSRLTQLFTRGAHHWNVSIVHICQALFFEGLRTARINAHYLVLMKTPADKLQISNLAKQVYPGNNKFFMEAFEDATGKSRGYLLVDLHPSTDDRYRLLTDVFNHGWCTVYVHKR